MLSLLIALSLVSPRITLPSTGGGGGYATVQDETTPLTARTKLNFTGAGVTCADNAGTTTTDCTISGGGAGSANVVEASVVLTGSGFFSTTVTGQTWVTGTSKVVCSPFATTADGLTVEVITIAMLHITASNLVAGTGFNVNVMNPYGLAGTVRVHCTGA